jgi:holo-[acyl-carrier protein] synthase
MMIGIGNDLIDIRRIEKAHARFGERFVKRCFTEIEIAKAERRRGAGLYFNTLAKRFAAKEACSKALGTGFFQGVYMKDIGVVNDRLGRPTLHLSNGAQARLLSMMPENKTPLIHVTLTDEPPMAEAIVMIEAV